MVVWNHAMESNDWLQDNQVEKSFVFVLNPIDVSGSLPIEIAPRHFFQRPDADQIRQIKKLLKLCTTFPYGIFSRPPYETDIVKVPGEKAHSYSLKYETLPPDKWRYWVISFEGTNAELLHVASAASVLRNDLELGFTVFGKNSVSGAGYGWHAQSLFSFFESEVADETAVLVTEEELREIPENYDLIKKISPDHEHITRAFRKFRDLKSLPRSSELVTIGLFSIIESLVTHSPKHSEDSLTHQIKTKIPLLSKRFQRNLDYVEHFGEIKEENVWHKLYGYRSLIVHGEHSNLSGTLKVLKDRKTVITFLKETTKLLLLLSLQEPTLLTDLKKC